MNRSLRLARVVTTPFTFSTLLYDQIAAIRESGIEVTLISSEVEHLSQIAHAQRVKYHCIPMVRRPDMLQDLRSLFALTRFLSANPFDIVHSNTPKAGLLTALAGAISGTSLRLHTYTGQRWATLTGIRRQVLRSFDSLIAKLCTETYADSVSQRKFLIDENIVSHDKISVLGAGSISGVNLERFDPGRWGGQTRKDTRNQLGIPQDAVVIAFVGRVTRDKGIVELIESFNGLRDRYPDLYLLLIGPFEPHLDPVPNATQSFIKEDERILGLGYSSKPEKYLGASDIFCLPSYREGFGSVVIEAGAMGLPSVATSIVGLMDAVEDGETGLLVPPRDSQALSEALEVLIKQPELCSAMGTAAREYVMNNFDADMINQAVVKEYFRLAQEHLP